VITLAGEGVTTELPSRPAGDSGDGQGPPRSGGRPSGRSPGEQPRSPRQPGQSPFRLYKPGQGTYVRWGSAVCAAIISLAFAAFLFEQLYPLGESIVRYIIPAVVLVGMAYLVFWLVGQNRTAVDFMIATEGEMKKVNWSTRREIIGATKIVIMTTLLMALTLFIVDMICIFVFGRIGVLKVDILSRMFTATPS
jgi:preprotein translocase SecE subunit